MRDTRVAGPSCLHRDFFGSSLRANFFTRLKTEENPYWWKMVMRRAHCVCVLICLSLAPLSFAHHIKPGTTKTLPITTSSPKARDLFVRAVTDYENLYLERANIGWRAAVEADPNFALALCLYQL